MAKKWWGDQLSGKYLEGFNPNICNRKWPGKLFAYESTILEFLLYRRMEKYGYLSSHLYKKLWLFPLIMIMIPLPLKFEIKAFFFRIKNDRGLKNYMLNSLIFAYSYMCRVSLFYRYSFRRLLRSEHISPHFYTL